VRAFMCYYFMKTFFNQNKNMGKEKLVYKLAVTAVFLAGFLIGGAYIRYIDTVADYNADMIQDAITRFELVQEKYNKLNVSGTSSDIMIQPVTTNDIMIQPVTTTTATNDIMIQP